MIDDWNPDDLIDHRPYYLWLDDRELFNCVLDEEDYLWAIRWKWSAKVPRRGSKVYAYRTLTSAGNRRSLYLHVEIMKRRSNPPSSVYVVVDHRDGNSLNNKRRNLRWATLRENRRNIRGCFPGDDSFGQLPLL